MRTTAKPATRALPSSTPKAKAKTAPAKAKAAETQRGWQAKAAKSRASSAPKQAAPKREAAPQPKAAQRDATKGNDDGYVWIQSPVYHPNNPDLLIGHEPVKVPRKELNQDAGQWGSKDGGFYA